MLWLWLSGSSRQVYQVRPAFVKRRHQNWDADVSKKIAEVAGYRLREDSDGIAAALVSARSVPGGAWHPKQVPQ